MRDVCPLELKKMVIPLDWTPMKGMKWMKLMPLQNDQKSLDARVGQTCFFSPVNLCIRVDQGGIAFYRTCCKLAPYLLLEVSKNQGVCKCTIQFSTSVAQKLNRECGIT